MLLNRSFHRRAVRADDNPRGFEPGDGNPAVASAMDNPQATTPEKGNPLWRIPVKSLPATRERPIYLPSRRPPTLPIAVAPSPEPPKAAAPPEPDQPALNLVGTIFGSGEGYAGFLDTATHGIVWLKTSKGEHGWILRSVADRESVLEKNYRTVVVRLPTITGDRQ